MTKKIAQKGKPACYTGSMRLDSGASPTATEAAEWGAEEPSRRAEYAALALWFGASKTPPNVWERLAMALLWAVDQPWFEQAARDGRVQSHLASIVALGGEPR